jgi:hypothetical protein
VLRETYLLLACRRRCKIAETLVEKNFDLAFHVIYEFKLPGRLHNDFWFNPVFHCGNLAFGICAVCLHACVSMSSHILQLSIYMLALLRHLLRGKKAVN